MSLYQTLFICAWQLYHLIRFYELPIGLHDCCVAVTQLSYFVHLRNEFDFWKVHGIMNTSGHLKSKWSPKGFTLTLKDDQSIHGSMNLPKIEFIAYIYILLPIKFHFFFITWLVFQIFYIKSDITYGLEQPKRQISALNVMAIRVQRHTNASKQATLLDGLDVSPLKWRVCGCGLNRFVHEGMNHISNVKIHLKTRSGNVNISHCVTAKGSIHNHCKHSISYISVFIILSQGAALI